MKPINKSERGNALIEFAIAISVLIPMVFGVVGIGVELGNGVAISQSVRDVGHMYSRGADFSGNYNRNLAARLAAGLNLKADGQGDGVLILSKIVTPSQAECDANDSDGDGSCRNTGIPVFSHRIVIGKGSLRPSNFGTPAESIISDEGNISPQNYVNNATAVADGFNNLLAASGIPAQAAGETAFLVEGFFHRPSLSFLSAGSGIPEQRGVYFRYVF